MKITKENLINLWEALEKILEGKRENNIGCKLCSSGIKKGYSYTPKETGIGYIVEACDCLVEYEHKKVILDLIKNSGIQKNELTELYPFLKYEYQMDLTFELLNILFNKKLNIFLSGSVGTGKTYTAMMMIKLFLSREKSVIFFNFATLLDRLRPKQDNFPFVHGDKLMSYLQNVPLLVLDDVLKEKQSEWVKERMFIIVNERYRRGFQTIITSNGDFENDFKRCFGEPIFSRLNSKLFYYQIIDKDKRT